MKLSDQKDISSFFNREPPYVNFYRYPPADLAVELDQQGLIEELLKRNDSYLNPNQFTIYIGIPFCGVKCNSCPFFKQLLPENEKRDQLIDVYVSYLVKQIYGIKEYGLFENKKCGAIYLGGGTASLLSSQQINLLLNAVQESFELINTAEITLEGNPVEFTAEYLNAVQNSAVNRLSIGVQSFQNKILRQVLNSPHDSEESHKSLQNAMLCRFRTVNVDLLYGLPEQSIEDWEYEVEATLKYRPQSITTNLYVIHKGSEMEELISKKQLRRGMGFERIIELEKWTYDSLIGKGYLETRAGDFCLPDHEQIYGKLTYTYGYEMIGFGAGAYSFINGYLIEAPTFSNLFQREIDYGHFLPVSKISKVADRKVLMERLIMMNLMSYSIDRLEFKKRFGTDALSEFKDIFSRLIYHKLVEVNDTTIRLTPEGRKWRRNIMSAFYSFKG